MRNAKRGCGDSVEKRCGPSQKLVANSLADIVQHYITHYRLRASDELSFYGGRTPFSEAVRVAANAIQENNKRHDHQRRVPGSALARLGRKLLALESEMENTKSFRELHALVKGVAANLKHIGELTIYDTAHRIGVKLGFGPKEIYLHAGTRKGASLFGVDTNQESIDKSAFPSEFQKLDPYEIEDILCIYEDDFRRLLRLGKLNVGSV